MFLLMLGMIFVTGLIFGSFLNSVTWRLPGNIKIVDFKSRSICPKCHNNIAWYDNIPLLSFFLLRAKCRSCKKKISWRYPLVELLFGIVVVLLYLKFGLTSEFIYYVLLSAILFSIFVIDLMHQIIPDSLVFGGTFLTLLFFILTDSPFLYRNLLAGGLAASFLLILHLVTRGRGMGLGDVKLGFFLSFILGWPKTIVWMMLSFVIGALVGLILIFLKKAGFGQKIAFAPYLISAFWITLFMGGFIVALVL